MYYYLIKKIKIYNALYFTCIDNNNTIKINYQK